MLRVAPKLQWHGNGGVKTQLYRRDACTENVSLTLPPIILQPPLCALICGGQWSPFWGNLFIKWTGLCPQWIQNIEKPKEKDIPNILPRGETPKPETHVSCLSNVCHQLQVLRALLLLISSLAFMSEGIKGTHYSSWWFQPIEKI